MKATNIEREIASLPPEAQQEVLDFVTILKTRYPTKLVTSKKKRIKLADEPFVGMWEGREDIQDSTAWVRKLRQQEWNHGT